MGESIANRTAKVHSPSQTFGRSLPVGVVERWLSILCRFETSSPTQSSASLLQLVDLYLARFSSDIYPFITCIPNSIPPYLIIRPFFLWDANRARTNPFNSSYDLISALRTGNELYVGTCAHEANTRNPIYNVSRKTLLQHWQILILISK